MVNYNCDAAALYDVNIEAAMLIYNGTSSIVIAPVCSVLHHSQSCSSCYIRVTPLLHAGHRTARAECRLKCDGFNLFTMFKFELPGTTLQ